MASRKLIQGFRTISVALPSAVPAQIIQIGGLDFIGKYVKDFGPDLYRIFLKAKMLKYSMIHRLGIIQFQHR